MKIEDGLFIVLEEMDILILKSIMHMYGYDVNRVDETLNGGWINIAHEYNANPHWWNPLLSNDDAMQILYKENLSIYYERDLGFVKSEQYGFECSFDPNHVDSEIIEPGYALRRAICAVVANIATCKIAQEYNPC